MKTLLIALLLLAAGSTIAMAQGMACGSGSTDITSVPRTFPYDTCHVFGTQNHHMGMMRIYRFYCLDSVNFHVNPTRSMPYDCMDNDSIRFEVCLHCRDANPYSTQVKAVTDQGELSWDVTMQAASANSVEATIARTDLIIYPNPATSSIRVPVLSTPYPTSAQAIDCSGRTTDLQLTITGSEAIISTADLPNGAYRLVLKRGSTIYGASDLRLVR